MTDEADVVDTADWSQLPAHPLVSVYMLTYNHERFIAQAIEGVVAQECGFDIELVIGEDCSTDNTLAIVLDYQRRYPALIRVLASKKNVGAYKNSIRSRLSCRGIYLAICEGDDFWMDKHKLARQVRHLEMRPDVAISFHEACEVDEDGRRLCDSTRLRLSKLGDKTCLMSREIISGAFIPTQTVMMRNIHEAQVPPSESIVNGDWHRFSMLAMTGYAESIPGIMAAYRIHKGGVWMGRSVQSRYFEQLRSAIVIEHDLAPEFAWMVASTLRWRISDVLIFCDESGFPLRRVLLARGVKALLHSLVCVKRKPTRWFLLLYYMGWVFFRFVKYRVTALFKRWLPADFDRFSEKL